MAHALSDTAAHVNRDSTIDGDALPNGYGHSVTDCNAHAVPHSIRYQVTDCNAHAVPDCNAHAVPDRPVGLID